MSCVSLKTPSASISKQQYTLRQGINAIHRHESQGDLADIEIGITASILGYHGDDDWVVEYGFSLSIAQDGGYRVNQEYGKLWGSTEDSEVAGFRIREGNVTHPDSLIPKDPTTNFI